MSNSCQSYKIGENVKLGQNTKIGFNSIIHDDGSSKRDRKHTNYQHRGTFFVTLTDISVWNRERSENISLIC